MLHVDLVRRRPCEGGRTAGESSLEAFRVGIGVAGSLIVIGGLIGTAGIQNPRR